MTQPSSDNESLVPYESLDDLQVRGAQLVNIVSKESTGKPLTQAQFNKVLGFMKSMTHGSVMAMSLICKGEKCPLFKLCPLALSGADLPLGLQCPVEQALVKMWVDKHLQSLGITDPSSPESSFDMDLLYEMAHQDLIKWRASATLSMDPQVVKTVDIGATPKGDIIEGEVEHPALKIIQDACRTHKHLREALLGTRKAQIEAGQQAGDPSVRSSDLVAQARKKLQLRQESLQETIKDAEIVEVKDGNR